MATTRATRIPVRFCTFLALGALVAIAGVALLFVTPEQVERLGIEWLSLIFA